MTRPRIGWSLLLCCVLLAGCKHELDAARPCTTTADCEGGQVCGPQGYCVNSDASTDGPAHDLQRDIAPVDGLADRAADRGADHKAPGNEAGGPDQAVTTPDQAVKVPDSATVDTSPPPGKWTALTTSVTDDYTAVAAQGTTVVVGTIKGDVLHSSNGGAKFTIVANLGSKVMSIALDGKNGVASSSKGKLYHTVNSGLNWGWKADCGSSPFSVAIKGALSVAVAAGDRCRSTNGGQNYDKKSVTVGGKIVQGRGVAIAVYKGKTVVLTSGLYPYSSATAPVIHRSEDGGATYKELLTALPGGYKAYAHRLSLSSSGHALLAGAKSAVYTSSDAGLTWTGTSAGTSNYAGHCTVALQPPLALVASCTTGGGAFISSNNGGYFAAVNDAVVKKTFLNAVAFDGQGNAYLAGKKLFKGTP